MAIVNAILSFLIHFSNAQELDKKEINNPFKSEELVCIIRSNGCKTSVRSLMHVDLEKDSWNSSAVVCESFDKEKKGCLKYITKTELVNQVEVNQRKRQKDWDPIKDDKCILLKGNRRSEAHKDGCVKAGYESFFPDRKLCPKINPTYQTKFYKKPIFQYWNCEKWKWQVEFPSK